MRAFGAHLGGWPAAGGDSGLAAGAPGYPRLRSFTGVWPAPAHTCTVLTLPLLHGLEILW